MGTRSVISSVYPYDQIVLGMSTFLGDSPPNFVSVYWWYKYGRYRQMGCNKRSKVRDGISWENLESTYHPPLSLLLGQLSKVKERQRKERKAKEYTVRHFGGTLWKSPSHSESWFLTPPLTKRPFDFPINCKHNLAIYIGYNPVWNSQPKRGCIQFQLGQFQIKTNNVLVAGRTI